MSDIHIALAMIKSDYISGEQTYFIDKTLSNSSCDDIPATEALNVTNYIDLQLSKNVVNLEVKQKLERLYNNLRNQNNLS